MPGTESQTRSDLCKQSVAMTCANAAVCNNKYLLAFFFYKYKLAIKNEQAPIKPKTFWYQNVSSGRRSWKGCCCQTVAAYESASHLTLCIKRCTSLAALTNIRLSLYVHLELKSSRETQVWGLCMPHARTHTHTFDSSSGLCGVCVVSMGSVKNHAHWVNWRRPL